MSDKTSRIDFLRAKHTEHLRLSGTLCREDELSHLSDIHPELGIASFFYAIDDFVHGVDFYGYYGVFYDMDSTFGIEMTSMRIYQLICIGHDIWEGEKIESAIGALMDEDAEYRKIRPQASQ